jgi:hypothetical protein
MTTKKEAGEKKGKVKVGKLNLNKETVKELTGSQAKRVQGGLANKCASYPASCKLSDLVCSR